MKLAKEKLQAQEPPRGPKKAHSQDKWSVKVNKAFRTYQKLSATVQTLSMHDRGQALPHQVQYVYKEQDLFPAQQELSPEYIERTNRHMLLDMQKVSNFESFAAKSKKAPSSPKRKRNTTQQMHLRLGRLVDPPLSETLTKFDHKKLDAIV